MPYCPPPVFHPTMQITIICIKTPPSQEMTAPSKTKTKVDPAKNVGTPKSLMYPLDVPSHSQRKVM